MVKVTGILSNSSSPTRIISSRFHCTIRLELFTFFVMVGNIYFIAFASNATENKIERRIYMEWTSGMNRKSSENDTC